MASLSDPPIGLAPRRAALRILERVRRGVPFEAARDLAFRDLEERDRRLAHELAAGVLRRQDQLDQSLAPLVPRGLATVDPAVRGILRLGAYQLASLDRVPPHAAVSTSVDLAREVAGNRAAGFVNAVLRGVGRMEPEPAPAGSRAALLAKEHSHPEWLVERWLARFGEADTARLLRWNDTPPALVVQPARAESAELLARWRAGGIECHEAPFGAGIVVGVRTPTALPGFSEGDCIVQDPAQALVVRFAAAPPDAVVYDACAAPGGKAVGLGRRARLVAAGEGRRSRIARLDENLRRAGTGREFALVADAAHPPVRAVDVVLLDAPCLGTGSFARHPDARGRVSATALMRLAARQERLLARAAPVVRPGGLLVYATCSLEAEENDVQIDRFLAAHPDFRREPGSTVPPELRSEAGDLTLLPQRHAMDGAFAARLRRVG